MPLNIIDINDKVLLEATSRVSQRIDNINRTWRFIANGRGVLAETKDRLREFDRREESKISSSKSKAVFHRDKVGDERKIGNTNDILSIEFFEAGLLAAKSVGRLSILYGDSYGTAFHVGHQIIMTNYHVFNNSDLASSCEFELNVEENKLGKLKQTYTYTLNPDRFFFNQ